MRNQKKWEKIPQRLSIFVIIAVRRQKIAPVVSRQICGCRHGSKAVFKGWGCVEEGGDDGEGKGGDI